MKAVFQRYEHKDGKPLTATEQDKYAACWLHSGCTFDISEHEDSGSHQTTFTEMSVALGAQQRWLVDLHGWPDERAELKDMAYRGIVGIWEVVG